jgi:hypothetical protein
MADVRRRRLQGTAKTSRFLIIPAKTGIQRFQPVESKRAEFRLSPE